jgi:tyrosinase
MPLPDGSSWVYTPEEVNSLGQLDYTYDDLTATATPRPANRVARRLKKLGAAPAAARAPQGGHMASSDSAELVGAHDGALQIKSSGARATVRLDSGARSRVSHSLRSASETSPPDHVYLQLENVRGTRDSYVLNVSVNQQRAGSVALFGLRRASVKDGQHGGAGLTFVLDITDIVDNLFLDNGLDTNALDVRIMPHDSVPEGEDITVGRVSVYRRGQQ